MDSLMNEKVTHRKYGSGNIVEVNDKIIMVKFDEIEDAKKFIYPDSFDGFMTFENKKLQTATIRVLEMEKAKREVEEERKKQEFEKIDEEKRIEKTEKLKKQRKATKAKTDRENGVQLKKEKAGKEHVVKI